MNFQDQKGKIGENYKKYWGILKEIIIAAKIRIISSGLQRTRVIDLRTTHRVRFACDKDKGWRVCVGVEAVLKWGTKSCWRRMDKPEQGGNQHCCDNHEVR